MRDKILFIGLALLIATGVTSFFYFFESYETEEGTGYSRKARQLPFLAAEQFLNRLGKTVNAKNETLDFTAIAIEDIVFLSKVDSILLTPTQIDAAVAWLQQGGQIVVGVGRETDSSDSLLARFDVAAIEEESEDLGLFGSHDSEEKLSDKLKRQNERFDEQEAEQESDECDISEAKESDNDLECTEEDEDETEIMLVTFDGNQKPLEVRLWADIFLQHPYLSEDDDVENSSDLDYELTAWSSNDSGVHLMQFEVGDGMLSVLSSSEMWKNYEINESDNAYFLAELVGGADTVYFHFNLQALPLRKLLMQHFPEALILLLAALLFWLWRGFVRVVRLESDVVGQRRALSEHLAATTELFAKHERYDLLLEPIVTDVEQQMSRIVSEFDQKGDGEKIELLAQHSGLDHQLIKNWFEDIAQTKNNETFLKVVKTGKMIRNRL